MSHTDKRNKDMENALIEGYIQMSDINLEEANSSVKSDNDSLQIYEEHLTECE